MKLPKHSRYGMTVAAAALCGLASTGGYAQATAAAVQSPATQTPVVSGSQRSQPERTKAFLANKRQFQNERNGRINDKANLGELNALIRAVAITPPAPAFVTDVGDLAALNESFLVDVAQALSLLGFKAGDLRRSPSASAEFVQAAAARIRGSATAEQQAKIADTVLIGTVQRTNPGEDLGDGLRSTVEIRMDTSVKGAFQAGDTVRLRRESGNNSGKGAISLSSEADLADGTTVALISSRALYRNSHASRGAACNNCVVELVPIFLRQGDTLIPTGGYDRPTTVSNLSSIKE